jgi:hypothetical protein
MGGLYSALVAVVLLGGLVRKTRLMKRSETNPKFVAL